MEISVGGLCIDEVAGSNAYEAVCDCNLEALEAILTNVPSAVFYWRDTRGNATLLCAAIAGSFWSGVRLLLQRGAEPNKLNSNKRAPLFKYVIKASEIAGDEPDEVASMIELLVAAGANPNLAESDLETPLHWAAKQMPFDTVRYGKDEHRSSKLRRC